jgi:nitrite reductase/ring-hydroxylating ferredoxin subunit
MTNNMPTNTPSSAPLAFDPHWLKFQPSFIDKKAWLQTGMQTKSETNCTIQAVAPNTKIAHFHTPNTTGHVGAACIFFDASGLHITHTEHLDHAKIGIQASKSTVAQAGVVFSKPTVVTQSLWSELSALEHWTIRIKSDADLEIFVVSLPPQTTLVCESNAKIIYTNTLTPLFVLDIQPQVHIEQFVAMHWSVLENQCSLWQIRIGERANLVEKYHSISHKKSHKWVCEYNPSTHSKHHGIITHIGMGGLVDMDVFHVFGLGTNNSHTFLKQNFIGLGKAFNCFQSLIHIPDNTWDITAEHLNKNLIIDETSQVYACPRLEIYSKDIASKHGSATDSIDMQKLYYLMARGLDKQQALPLLIQAFALEDAASTGASGDGQTWLQDMAIWYIQEDTKQKQAVLQNTKQQQAFVQNTKQQQAFVQNTNAPLVPQYKLPVLEFVNMETKQVYAIDIADKPSKLLVVKNEQNQIFAFWDNCPHKDVSMIYSPQLANNTSTAPKILWDSQHSVFTCPRHSAHFYVGNTINNTAHSESDFTPPSFCGLAMVPCFVENGTVYVNII